MICRRGDITHQDQACIALTMGFMAMFDPAALRWGVDCGGRYWPAGLSERGSRRGSSISVTLLVRVVGVVLGPPLRIINHSFRPIRSPIRRGKAVKGEEWRGVRVVAAVCARWGVCEIYQQCMCAGTGMALRDFKQLLLLLRRCVVAWLRGFCGCGCSAWDGARQPFNGSCRENTASKLEHVIRCWLPHLG